MSEIFERGLEVRGGSENYLEGLRIRTETNASTVRTVLEMASDIEKYHGPEARSAFLDGFVQALSATLNSGQEEGLVGNGSFEGYRTSGGLAALAVVEKLTEKLGDEKALIEISRLLGLMLRGG